MRDTFQERIAPKSIETDMEKLRMKFLALNVDFDGLYVSIGSRKPAHAGIKKRYPRKSRYFSACWPVLWKRLQIGMGMLTITTSTSDKLFDDEMVEINNLTVYEQELL